MLKDQVIEFVTLNERITTFDNREAFELRKDRPALWLQKACFFVLRKLGAFYVDSKVSYERHRINGSTFLERLSKQQDGLYRFFNRHGTRLLIGAEDYAELMNELASTYMFSFSAEYIRDNQLMGMKVQVIPWMRGVVVMPDDATSCKDFLC